MERTGSYMRMESFINACKSGHWQQQVEKVRNSGDIEKHKKMLPAIVPGLAVDFHEDLRDKVARRGEGRQSGYLVIDYDKVPADQYATLFEMLATNPHIYAVCRSAGGDGIFAVLAYETEFVMQNEDGSVKEGWNFNPVYEVLKEHIIPHGFDAKCNDLPRLRFVSYDPDAHINHEAIPVQLEITEQRWLPPRCRKERIEYNCTICG